MEGPRGLEGDAILEGDQGVPKSIPGCFGPSALSDDQLIADFPVAFAEGQQPQYFHFRPETMRDTLAKSVVCLEAS